MALIKWTPFLEPFGDWDKMVDEFRRTPGAGFSPAMDIYEKGKDLIVEMQLPGIDADKVDVSVENDVLTVQGKSEKKSEVEEKNYYRKEIHQGGFYRSISLPAHVVGDKAKASYDEGVLKISIPKKEEVKGKKVKVEVKKKK
jgi:HSP20 family protein